MKKTLILLVFSLFSLLFFFMSTSQKAPAFLMTNEHVILSKGQYGSVFIIEVTFDQVGLDTLIAHPLSENVLFVLDEAFIKRADHIVELLIQHNRQIALTAPFDKLEEHIKTYVKTFDKKPLWLLLPLEDQEAYLQKEIFIQQMNLFAPSITLQQPYPKTIKKGNFVHLKLSQKNDLQLTPLLTWMETQSFVSIEESLFGYEIKSSQMP